MSYESLSEAPAGIPLVLGFMSNDILPRDIFTIQATSEIPFKTWTDPSQEHTYTLEKHIVGNGVIRYFLKDEFAEGQANYTYGTDSVNVQACEANGTPLYDTTTSPEFLERAVIEMLSHYTIEQPHRALKSSTDRKFAGLIGQIILDDHTQAMINQLLDAPSERRASMLDVINESVAERTPGADPSFLKRSVRTAIFSAAKNR